MSASAPMPRRPFVRAAGAASSRKTAPMAVLPAPYGYASTVAREPARRAPSSAPSARCAPRCSDLDCSVLITDNEQRAFAKQGAAG